MSTDVPGTVPRTTVGWKVKMRTRLSFGYPPGASLGPAASLSFHGILHEVAGYVLFGSLAAACFVFARRFSMPGGRSAWAVYSLLTGLGNTRLHRRGLQRVVEWH